MIAKAPKAGGYGTNTAGALRYLFGRGRANEHTNPHLVAAWDEEWLAGGAFADILNRRGGLARLARHLDANMTGHDVDVPGGHVYHVSLSVHARDGQLGDAAWRQLVEDAVAHLGFGPDEHGRRGCRWVAVHHGLNTTGNDHVHLVVNLVRGDGRIASTFRDWPRWRTWCRAVEDRYRLTPTSPAGAGRAAATRPEVVRRGQARGTDRDWLRQILHSIAAASASELDFVRLLDQSQLRYRPRLSSDATKVVGYSVALPRHKQLWISGSSLRRDLSLPRLRARWYSDTPEVTARAAALWTGRQPIPRVQEHLDTDASARQWRDIHAQLRTVQTGLADSLASDVYGAGRWHQAAAHAADLVAVLARDAAQAHQLHAAADLLARAGQIPRGQRPPPGPHPVVSLLLGAARLAAVCASPEPVMLAALLLLAYGIVRLLAKVGEQYRIHAAARRYLHHAQRRLAEHPTLKPKPGEPARLAAVGQAAAALTPPPRRRATGQQPPATTTRTPGAPPRQHAQPPTQRRGLTR